MEQKLVTVVVPVYNVEKYLDRCLMSITKQSYRNLEIILVDDASQDTCPQKCDEWAKKDSRIRVIHKENGGLGMARNSGLFAANGDYICFFDSDDYVDCDTVEICMDRILTTGADVAIFGFCKETASNEVFIDRTPTVQDGTTYCKSEVTEKFLPDFVAPNPKTGGEVVFPMSACCALYSLEKLKAANWSFASERDIISEDVYSLLELYGYIDKVTVVKRAFYHYCENNASLTQSYRNDRYEQIKHFYSESLKLCEKLNYNEDVKHRISKPYLAFTIAALKQEFAKYRESKDKTALFDILNDETLNSVLKENRHDKVSKTRKVLFFAIRNKCHPLTMLLLKSKA